MAIDPVRKPRNPADLQVVAKGRIYQLTPDGSQWEIKIHLEGDIGMGPEIIGEVTFRSYNAGIVPLMGAVVEAPKLAGALVAKISNALKQQERRIIPAEQMPKDMPL